MGHSQVEKARNRARILKAAARQIRDQGLESVSVGGLMEKVNLTHGGFYGHFDSRSDLLAEALRQALEEGEGHARGQGSSADRPNRFASFVRSYLSRTHRDSRAAGCAISALVSDVGRAGELTRAVMSKHIERFIDDMARAFGEDGDAKAIVAVAAMIGALGLSRVLADPKRSDAVLKAVRDYVIAMKRIEGI
jgi:TetR/AcrR family transcriptional repressor of nem operon